MLIKQKKSAKNRYNPKPTITKIIIFSLNKQKQSRLKMNDDDYGVDNRMDDEEDIEIDDEDSQNISQEYGDSEQAEGQDELDREDRGTDEEREDEEGDELESVPEEEEPENRYEVIQEDEVVYDQPNTERITSPFMTKYEKARIIGVRAVQISKNSPLYLTADSNSLMNWDPLTIAEKELSEKKIPFIVRRYLPDGSFEDWKLSELKTFD